MALATAPDAQAAQRIGFAFFSEVAHASRNLVFTLLMNEIRAAYFAHAEQLPVTAEHHRPAPLYERAAVAIGAGDEDAASAAVSELAARQRESVETVVGAVART